MRIAFALLIAAVASSPVHARSDAIKFEGVQEHCVQVGDIKFGANGRWPSCRVTKGRWFATIDFLDLYQAQYCLGKDDGGCDRRAFLVFANRAYTPNAQIVLKQLDSGAVEYDDPVVVQTQHGDILTLTARIPGGALSKSYYLWRAGRWMPIDAQAWLRELSKRLPKWVLAKDDVWPDMDTMSARVPLAQRGESSPGSAVANVELALAKDRFTVRKVTLAQKTE